MKFREFSGKARRRSARKWKGWFGAIQVSISGGDFCLQNSKFTWFSWKKCNFHEFHEISQFSQKTALFAPKCILGTLGPQKHQYSGGYGRISASGRKCAFFAKSRTFCSLSYSSQKSLFSWFSWFSWKTRIFELCRISRLAKVRKSAFSWFSWNFHEIKGIPGIFRISRNFDKMIK